MFEELIVQFAALAGVAALVAALVNILKTFGVVKDGDAQKWSAGFSLAAFVAFVALRLFKPEVNIDGLDTLAASISELALYILGFLVQIGLPAQVHRWLSDGEVPVIGYSHYRNYGEIKGGIEIDFEQEG